MEYKNNPEVLEWARKHWMEASDVEKKHWEFVFPVLAESEDEKIRKSLLEHFMACGATHYGGIPIKSIVAYLEKKRETEELSTRLNGLMQEYVKAGKDEEEQEHRLKCYQLFWDALGDSKFFEQKEQKPVKLNDDTEVGIDRALQIVKAAKGNLCGYQSDDGIYECDHAIQTLERILKSGIEQKPAEWAELQSEFKSINEAFEDGKKEVVAHPERYDLCKPVEWSKEDEKMFGRLKEILNIADAELCKKLNGEAILIGEGEFNHLKFGIAHCLSWLELRLKSLRPQPHWKPSEYQMNALDTAQMELCGTEYNEGLCSLIDDLKKL